MQQAAVDAITRSLALEWGTDYDIRVNGIAPGPIGDTPGLSKLAPDEMKIDLSTDSRPLYKAGEKWPLLALQSSYPSSPKRRLCILLSPISMAGTDASYWCSSQMVFTSKITTFLTTFLFSHCLQVVVTNI